MELAKKIITAMLLILIFLMVLSKTSITFDGDLGWHLRFGQDAANGAFPYMDSYTWGSFGEPWINHEWGGDILFWQIYNHLGYYALIIITSLALTASFYLASKIYNHRTTLLGLVTAVIAIKTINHLINMRLAILSVLFFTIIWWTLEKIPQKKYYYWWPILLLIWSAIHGSWTLGFIIINIYIFGNLIQNIISHYQSSFTTKQWTKKNFLQIIGAQMISIGIILFNPYGIRIFTEVLAYFSHNFYKTHITEWVASYVYPVFWPSLIFATIALLMAFLLFKNKRLNLPRLFLITALFISGFMYKRNILFVVLVGVPTIVDFLYFIWQKIQEHRPKWYQINTDKIVQTAALTFGGLAIICLVTTYGARTEIYRSPWEQKNIMKKNLMPYDAIQFLKKETAGKQTNKIFNEFSWGGYMNWELRNSLVFLDGRGTATWLSKKNPGKTMLEDYYTLKYDTNGLTEIEKQDIHYIILQNNHFIPYPPPDKINQLLFGEELKKIYHPEKSRLEIDLNNSPNWRLIYTDKMANIWRHLAVR